MINPTTTDREGRIKQKLDEMLGILDSPVKQIRSEDLLEVVNVIVAAELKEERQRTLKLAREKLPDTKWHKQPGFILKQTTEYEEGYNTAIIDFDAALSELEGEITGNEKDK